jgi:hypothetical protein
MSHVRRMYGSPRGAMHHARNKPSEIWPGVRCSRSLSAQQQQQQQRPTDHLACGRGSCRAEMEESPAVSPAPAGADAIALQPDTATAAAVPAPSPEVDGVRGTDVVAPSPVSNEARFRTAGEFSHHTRLRCCWAIPRTISPPASWCLGHLYPGAAFGSVLPLASGDVTALCRCGGEA